MADRADVEVPKTPSLKGVVLLSVMWFTSLVGALVLMAPSLALLPVPLDGGHDHAQEPLTWQFSVLSAATEDTESTKIKKSPTQRTLEN